MILDIFLVITFLASIATLWYRISIKIPELVAIPDEVITARLQEDSARARLFVLQLKKYWREEKYKEAFWKILGKTLYKFHIALLRTDNWTTVLLKHIRARGAEINGNGSGEYLKQLQQESRETQVKGQKIQEVRMKK